MHPQSTARRPHSMTSTERFWSYVEKTETCWLWTGGKIEGGYGRFRVLGRPKLAHRHAYEITYGLLLDGMDCCHTCDNPSCVRPSHLFPGTHKENMENMAAKGRARSDGNFSVTNGHAKLTEQDVKDIRRRYAVGNVSQRALAAEYGVGCAVICRIIQRKDWPLVEEDSDAPPAQPRLIEGRRGQDNHFAKLTDEIVRDIRRRAACGKPQTALAKEYHLSAGSVSMIVSGKTWRHLLP